jgi:hypothetical protein
MQNFLKKRVFNFTQSQLDLQQELSKLARGYIPRN